MIQPVDNGARRPSRIDCNHPCVGSCSRATPTEARVKERAHITLTTMPADRPMTNERLRIGSDITAHRNPLWRKPMPGLLWMSGGPVLFLHAFAEDAPAGPPSVGPFFKISSQAGWHMMFCVVGGHDLKLLDFRIVDGRSPNDGVPVPDVDLESETGPLDERPTLSKARVQLTLAKAQPCSTSKGSPDGRKRDREAGHDFRRKRCIGGEALAATVEEPKLFVGRDLAVVDERVATINCIQLAGVQAGASSRCRPERQR